MNVRYVKLEEDVEIWIETDYSIRWISLQDLLSSMVRKYGRQFVGEVLERAVERSKQKAKT
jgi:hypothetical protein